MTRLDVHARLGDADVVSVRELLDAAIDADGVYPLSEHVFLHLTHGGDVSDQNLLLWDGDELVGYAHLDTTDAVAGASAELVVRPEARGHGHGSALIRRLTELTSDGRLRLWSHGAHPAATALAAKLGFEQTRVLWQMRRSLYAPLPQPALPADVVVRTFRVGEDEERWVAVNNRAFADHPDQGSWTIDDLRMREAEPWFDPEGFFLAFRGADLVAFHWTKVHGSSNHGGTHHGSHEHEAIGEVYVVGTDPSAQGQGLGREMTVVGLRHLRTLGLSSAMLYVDEVNTNAIRVYERLGFTRWDTDVCYYRA